MVASVKDLRLILELFFPPELAMQQAIYVLTPLTGWKKTIQVLLTRAFEDEANGVEAWLTGINSASEYTNYICADIDKIYLLLGLTHANSDPSSFAFRSPPPILTTSRLNCRYCPPAHRNLIPSLRRRRKGKMQSIWVLNSSFEWESATLVVGHCATCKADYYPDRITRVGTGRERAEVLEYDAEYLRVSKSGIWVHRRIALAQEKALQCYHSGWSNFADWINGLTQDINVTFTYRQSQRLFLEHFSRRLLISHDKSTTFTCTAHSSSKSLAEKVRAAIGINHGVIPSAMHHGCMDCTHIKRYHSGPPVGDAAPLPANLPEVLAQQPAPAEGSPRGYARLAVMDGKSLTHRKCALDVCERPLYNYKNGHFCETHLDLRSKCGIIPCGRDVRSSEDLTCDDATHIAWYKQYDDRFHRLSFPGVQRVDLQSLGDTPGNKVVHTFKAKSTYCLQTIQWACGVPIGWGKCYRSESTPQVLAFINKTWQEYPDCRPSFIAYDKACDLLRHIATQNISDLWLTSTKFIVDAWHYIGHRATDILCRTRCNPAPTDGSQPDLVLTEVDDNGVVHQTRAFNTETAEQLNSWLNGFESQLRQMTDVNFDFYVHVLMMLYGETVEKRVVSKKRELTDEFWDEVEAIVDMDIDSS
ncbi:hypothetical protein FB45DRAFT_982898 [Roridomyces roridus]|uniref:CxC5 like cysteine cluster associated with KDZ domain-containing protein n=1 Tax=Roridomyces roridus TaxID=1738132 RepID=A0AAD7FA98_9AGAR|nr:hypothetical protein FB45DRAFT_982898 [Roridomyces roridus]